MGGLSQLLRSPNTLLACGLQSSPNYTFISTCHLKLKMTSMSKKWFFHTALLICQFPCSEINITISSHFRPKPEKSSLSFPCRSSSPPVNSDRALKYMPSLSISLYTHCYYSSQVSVSSYLNFCHNLLIVLPSTPCLDIPHGSNPANLFDCSLERREYEEFSDMLS